MSRIPCLDTEALPEALRSLTQGRIINLYRILAHAPQSVEQIARLGAALFTEGGLSAVDRELLILTCATGFDSEYEWAQHVSISRAVGVTDEQRAALRRLDHDAAAFSPAQRALVAFTAAVAAGPRVDDALYARLSEHYDEQQVVEALVLVGFYFLVARVCTVLDVEIDAPEGDEVLRMAQAMQAG
ncbi:carboxymuconolactone decarboxylase family protein [Streptomyces sp. TG1A-8]|uniref:carboxymuconolactone decarboxylase family protein n=1 Tax=Streptomyces sp. TG1A-8 TaxID=3051385 RepID=UPI00265C11E4|nr:carboxymuconolactone decarboxylase family protein [Streptomyces sp. TG1A-8]MDO0924254.1 carboxymuconolactone decarboxylase family protein [Streptomyces sp. TG1A-8]